MKFRDAPGWLIGGILGFFISLLFNIVDYSPYLFSARFSEAFGSYISQVFIHNLDTLIYCLILGVIIGGLIEKIKNDRK